MPAACVRFRVWLVSRMACARQRVRSAVCPAARPPKPHHNTACMHGCLMAPCRRPVLCCTRAQRTQRTCSAAACPLQTCSRRRRWGWCANSRRWLGGGSTARRCVCVVAPHTCCCHCTCHLAPCSRTTILLPFHLATVCSNTCSRTTPWATASSPCSCTPCPPAGGARAPAAGLPGSDVGGAQAAAAAAAAARAEVYPARQNATPAAHPALPQAHRRGDERVPHAAHASHV